MSLSDGMSLYGNFRTKTFQQVWEDADSFLSDWKTSGLYTTGLIADASVRTLFYLLYARYANNHIASSDPTQFKYKVYEIIFSIGPSWEKRLDIQKKLRGLTEDELLQGSKSIYNHAFNPSTDPSTGTLEELEYINDQNTSNYKRGKLAAYSTLWELIKFDITDEFLKKFKKLFLTVVSPEYPLWYENEAGEE